MDNPYTTQTMEKINKRNQILVEAIAHKNIICPAIYKHFKHTEDGILNN